MGLRILIETIPHSQQLYDTVGDWVIEPDGTWHIRISELPEKRALFPEKFAYLVALHELVEMGLCRAGGVTQQDVDEFDIGWNPHSRFAEPGDDPRSPYYQQHQSACGIERTVAAILQVDWAEYERAIDALSQGKTDES